MRGAGVGDGREFVAWRVGVVATVVGTLPDASLAGFESTAGVICALLFTVPAGPATLTVIVMVVELPCASVKPGLLQDALAPAPVQVKPAPVPEAKVNCAGSVSVTVTGPVKLAAPTFLSVSVYVPVPPITKFPFAVLVRARSGCAVRLITLL